jgi:hypothetical protein
MPSPWLLFPASRPEQGTVVLIDSEVTCWITNPRTVGVYFKSIVFSHGGLMISTAPPLARGVLRENRPSGVLVR